MFYNTYILAILLGLFLAIQAQSENEQERNLLKRSADPDPDPHRHFGYHGHRHHHHGWGHHHHHHHHGWGHHHHHGWHGHFHFLHKRDVQNVERDEVQVSKRSAEPHDAVVVPHRGHYDVVTLPHHHHQTQYNYNQGYYGYRPLFHSFGKRSADLDESTHTNDDQSQSNGNVEVEGSQAIKTLEKRSAEPHDAVVVPHRGHHDVVTLPHHHHQNQYNHNQGFYGYRPLFHSLGKRSAGQDEATHSDDLHSQNNGNEEIDGSTETTTLEKRSAEPHGAVVIPHGGHYDVVTLPHHHHQTQYSYNQGYYGYRPLYHSFGKRSAEPHESTFVRHKNHLHVLPSHQDHHHHHHQHHHIGKRNADPQYVSSIVVPHNNHLDVVKVPYYHQNQHYHLTSYARPTYYSYYG